MTSTTTPTAQGVAEQLTLLPEATAPVRFRLDEATRRRGLRHIAEIRARLSQPPDQLPPAEVRRRPAA